MVQTATVPPVGPTDADLQEAATQEESLSIMDLVEAMVNAADQLLTTAQALVIISGEELPEGSFLSRLIQSMEKANQPILPFNLPGRATPIGPRPKPQFPPRPSFPSSPIPVIAPSWIPPEKWRRYLDNPGKNRRFWCQTNPQRQQFRAQIMSCIKHRLSGGSTLG